MIGRHHGGLITAIAYAILALAIGIALVETPYWIADHLDRRRLTSASSKVLRDSLEHDFRHYGHMKILRELSRRGESIEFEFPRLLRFLASPSVANRVVACAGLLEFFPAIGVRLADYNPYHEDSSRDPIIAELLHEFPPNS